MSDLLLKTLKDVPTNPCLVQCPHSTLLTWVPLTLLKYSIAIQPPKFSDVIQVLKESTYIFNWNEIHLDIKKKKEGGGERVNFQNSNCLLPFPLRPAAQPQAIELQEEGNVI